MTESPVSSSRPRTVEVAFWCWLVAAVLLAVLGLWIVSHKIPLFYVSMGGILLLGGLGQGYLAGRARRGQQRFASAAVGLALASVALLAVMLILGIAAILGVLGVPAILGVFLVAAIMVLLITGAAMSQRPTSQQWYESQSGS